MSLVQTFLRYGGLLVVVAACSPDQRWAHFQRQLAGQWQLLHLVHKEHPTWLESAEIDQDSVRVAVVLKKLITWSPKDGTPPPNWSRLTRNWQEAASQLRALRHNPLVYSIRPHLEALLQKPITPAEKIVELRTWLAQAPDYYYRARRNLRKPARLQCIAAVEEGIQTVAHLEGTLRPWLMASKEDSAQARSTWAAFEQAELAVKDYLAWCRSVALASPQRPVLRQ